MDKFELYNLDVLKEMHKIQLERKENIENRLSLPIFMISAISTIIWYSLHQIDGIKISNCIVITVYFILGILSITSLIISFIYLFKMKFNKFYGELPLIKDLIKDVEKFEKYYEDEHFKEWNQKKKKLNIINDVNDDLKNKYIEIIQRNTEINDKKMEILHNVNMILYISLIFAILTGMFSLYFELNKENISKMKIVNFNDNNILKKYEELNTKNIQLEKDILKLKLEIEDSKKVKEQTIKEIVNKELNLLKKMIEEEKEKGSNANEKKK